MFFITALDLIYNGIESFNERCVTIRERYIIILDNFLFFFFFRFPRTGIRKLLFFCLTF